MKKELVKPGIVLIVTSTGEKVATIGNPYKTINETFFVMTSAGTFDVEDLEVPVYFYDVCNDYSLDLRDDVPTDLDQYETWSGPQGIVYNHKRDDEIHYLKSTDPDLSGIELY